MGDPMADSLPDPETDEERDEERDPSLLDEEHDPSVIDEMRGSGVGVEDPNIVGDADTAAVDEQVQKDQPPVV